MYVFTEAILAIYPVSGQFFIKSFIDFLDFNKNCDAVKPTVIITFGRNNCNSSLKNVEQRSSSNAVGFRFFGGRHLMQLVIRLFDSDIPASVSSNLKAFPAAPENGSLFSISFFPGASPMIQIPDSPEPTPCMHSWRFKHNAQFKHILCIHVSFVTVTRA